MGGGGEGTNFVRPEYVLPLLSLSSQVLGIKTRDMKLSPGIDLKKVRDVGGERDCGRLPVVESVLASSFFCRGVDLPACTLFGCCWPFPFFAGVVMLETHTKRKRT